MTELLVFQLEMLPQIPRAVIEQHFSSTGLVDPAEYEDSPSCVDNIIQHIERRIEAIETVIFCTRLKSQCFVDSYDYLHYVKVHVVPKNRNQPVYSAYRIDFSRYMIDRPEWGGSQ